MTRDIIPEEREEKITRIVQKATRTISPKDTHGGHRQPRPEMISDNQDEWTQGKGST